MKDVLLEFLVPRFRTDEEIKVIRSNLYLNDVVSNRFKDGTSNLGSDEIKKDEEEIAKLNGQLEKIQEEKEDVVRQISKGYGRVQDNNLQLGKRVQKDLAHLEELKFHQELMAHRVSSTASLLVDMSNAQVRKVPSIVASFTDLVLTALFFNLFRSLAQHIKTQTRYPLESYQNLKLLQRQLHS